MSGVTIKQALTNDLRQDFNYTGNFRVNEIVPEDELEDKEGNLIPRYKVTIELLDELNTEHTRPLGMRVKWLKE